MTYKSISADNETLLEHVPQSANQFLDHAIGALDERFGAGFAKDHPDLVASYMRTCAVCLGAAFVARAIESIPALLEPAIKRAMDLEEQGHDRA